jgi:hypothetical protein
MNWTAAEDHKNMMDQLGIKALRPGPSGNESAPNHANYDEATANPFPKLPEVLTLHNGKKVTTPEAWWKQRRPEIVEDFEREVVGRVPKTVPGVTWSVTETVNATVGSRPVVGRQLVGHVDNASYPPINVDIQMTLVTPADATHPVPVMMMFGRGMLPGQAPPAPRGRYAVSLNPFLDKRGIELSQAQCSLSGICTPLDVRGKKLMIGHFCTNVPTTALTKERSDDIHFLAVSCSRFLDWLWCAEALFLPHPTSFDGPPQDTWEFRSQLLT